MTGLGADRAAASAVGGETSSFTAQRVLGALPRLRPACRPRPQCRHDHHHQGGVPGRGHRHHSPRPALLRLPTAWAPSRAAPAPWGRQWAYGTATSSEQGRRRRRTHAQHTEEHSFTIRGRRRIAHRAPCGPCFCSASSRPSAAGLVSRVPGGCQAPARVSARGHRPQSRAGLGASDAHSSVAD